MIDTNREYWNGHYVEKFKSIIFCTFYLSSLFWSYRCRNVFVKFNTCIVIIKVSNAKAKITEVVNPFYALVIDYLILAVSLLWKLIDLIFVGVIHKLHWLHI